MRKVLLTLGILIAAVLWNRSLHHEEMKKVKGAVLKSNIEQNLEEGSEHADSEEKKNQKQKKSKRVKSDAPQKLSKKALNKKKLRKVSKTNTRKNKKRSKRSKKKVIDEGIFQANFDDLPDYSFYKGESDFKEEISDAGM